jgi:putative polyhydroxyalkanoate system protein
MPHEGQTLKVRIPHQLGKDEARRRVASAASRLKGEHAAKVASIEDRWEGDHLLLKASAMGQSLSGDVEVGDKEVHIRVVLPWLLAKFAEKLRPQIEKQTREALKLPKP